MTHREKSVKSFVFERKLIFSAFENKVCSTKVLQILYGVLTPFFWNVVLHFKLQVQRFP